MFYKTSYLFIFILLTGLSTELLSAQISQNIRGIGSNFGQSFISGGGSASIDNLEERDIEKEQVDIHAKGLFDKKIYSVIDSHFNNNGAKGSLFMPYGHTPISNYGNPVYTYLFDFQHQPGWYYGMNVFDAYKHTLANTKTYYTNKPFASLEYLIGSNEQQQLSAFYTQNVRPNLNILFDFRFMNSTGYFKNQNANFSNLKFGIHYTTKNRKYGLYAFYIRNNARSNDNGGVLHDSFIRDTKEAVYLSNRSTVPVNIGDFLDYSRNPFNLTLTKGKEEINNLVYINNQFNVGHVDSFMMADSIKKFYFIPKWRWEHTLIYKTNTFNYIDRNIGTDALLYQAYYQYPDSVLLDTLRISDKWSIVKNSAKVTYYRKPLHPQTYWSSEIGYEYMILYRQFNALLPKHTFYNIYLQTRLQYEIPDRSLRSGIIGTYYLAGSNRYNAHLQFYSRYTSPKGSLISVKWLYNSKSPGAIYQSYSAYNYYLNNLNNLQLIHSFTLSTDWYWKRPQLHLSAKVDWIKNYIYFANYNNIRQYADWISVPSIEIQKSFTVFKHFYWVTRLTMQAPLQIFVKRPFSNVIQLPLFYTFNQLYYQHYIHRNFLLSTGFELKYNTPFKAPYYNSIYGTFIYQSNQQISNFPEVHFFLKAKIKTKFSLSWRIENLNTIRVVDKSLKYSGNNFTVMQYPFYELSYQLGISWDFIN